MTMASAAPAPAASSSHSAAVTRKSSLRSGLRRAPARPQVSRAESNPVLSAAHNSKSQYAGNDSSDDEIPVPMKLSALTKALLNDEGAEPERDNGRVRTRAQSHRPSSPVNAEPEKLIKRRSVLSTSMASIGEERRHTRASSAQVSSRPTSPVRSQPSRESSPVRKRVVRLSATSGTAAAASQIKPAKRRSTSNSLSTSRNGNRPPSRADSASEEKANASEIKDKDLNTPAQQGRVVRIAVGSSGNRGRSDSSAVSSKPANLASSFHSHAAQSDENDVPEAPQTAPRQQGPSNPGSASRLGSNGSRNRHEDNQAVQSAMRVKRVGKIPGSFLSGPARRGRRRQSEEDPENGGEQGQSSQGADGQQARDSNDYEQVDGLASSYYVPDRLASGSPVSSRSSGRTNSRKELPSTASEDGRVQRSNSPDHDEIPIPHYRIPPPRAELPAKHDQENEAPPTFKRNKPPAMSFLEKEIPKVSARPLSVAEVGGSALRPTSPERVALGSLSRNTPRRAAPAPPPKMSILEAATSTAGAATTVAAKRRNYMKVNGKCYTRLDSLGRGGSGKVYRVAADNGKMFALKRVSIEGADELTVRGFKGEIDLLKKLSNVERVITLYDYEMNEEKQVLSLLMEMGELDLNTLLRLRLSAENAKFDPVFVRYYWQEMLECLAAVHTHDIVHSDLKPANFVVVQGRLKLIDFGIANAIQTDETVNVHRETQIGTPNYMSPESLIDSNATDAAGHRIGSSMQPNAPRPKLMKLGKPSDIWSLGCILFQMVYGTPPFGHIPNQMARCHAIINWQYAIEFRDRGVGGAPVPPSLVRTMKRCLARDIHLRPTAEELLSRSDPFLYPVEAPEGTLPITDELLGRIIQSVVTRCRERMPTEAEALSIWPQAYWGSVAMAVGREVSSSRGSGTPEGPR
ncbi:kinase-like protein [Jackrogersella minutella]|nr:kinase-like protein [Jackrogersella minutella]